MLHLWAPCRLRSISSLVASQRCGLDYQLGGLPPPPAETLCRDLLESTCIVATVRLDRSLNASTHRSTRLRTQRLRALLICGAFSPPRPDTQKGMFVLTHPLQFAESRRSLPPISVYTRPIAQNERVRDPAAVPVCPTKDSVDTAASRRVLHRQGLRGIYHTAVCRSHASPWNNNRLPCSAHCCHARCCPPARLLF